MKEELGQYKRHIIDNVDTVPANIGQELKPKIVIEKCMQFWKMFYGDLPQLSSLDRLCITLAPSSATVERVFPLLKSNFTVNQMTFSLEDYTSSRDNAGDIQFEFEH